MDINHKIGNLEITAPDEWLDVTHELEDDAAPFTLARSKGFGVIQFSLATYEKGALPEVNTDHLSRLVADFAQSRELGRGYNTACEKATLLVCASSFDFENRFLRVWYCSNGRDIVLVTYNCEKGLERTELSDCERIVRNLQFKG
jgi:hypothetical protein